MKKILTSAIAILAMVGCTSEDFVGDKELQRQNEEGAPISFNLVSAPPTRATQNGLEAATALNNNFVVYGWKTKDGTTPETQVVFNNYQANYVDGSAATTTSNSAGWEYVGYTNVPGGVTANVGVTAFATSSDNATGVDQSIKYWDYSASKYEFFGYSLGKGVTSGTPATTTYATATALSHTTPVSYTLSGSQAELAACYISDLLTKTDMSATNTQVQLQFRKMESKVRIALYETIPGYSVKDVKFYASGDNSETPTTTAYLYAGSSTLPAGGTNTYTVTFDTNGKPQVTVGSGGGTSANLSFGVADATNPSNTNTWDNWAHRDYKEVSDADVTANANADTLFIGRASNEATISESQSVLPNPMGTMLTLKVDYTLVSRDGYGETIEVKGATATVPAAYTQWQPNCSYTYLFKITDEDLEPITLDAVVNINADGKQETITTVTEPSITTFGVLDGKYSVGKSEYEYGADIYATIMKANSVVTPDVNVKVYTVAYKSGATADQIAAYPITEGSVADVIGKTGTVIEATEYTTNVTSVTSVPSEDGSTKTIDALKLQKPAAGIYAVEYTYTELAQEKKVYKVIRVVPSISVYQAPNGYEEVDVYAAGTAYVVVNKVDNGTALTLSGEGVNANLYTATLANDATLSITEATVAQALADGTEDPTGTWTLTGGLTVTKVSGLTTITAIPTGDTSSITVNGASFTATEGMTYVFEYIYTDPTDPTATRTKKIYKVIKVASGS